MAVAVLRDPEQRLAVMYCTTSDWAFGPTFTDEYDPEDFLVWLREHWDEVASALGLSPVGLDPHGGPDPRDWKDDDLEALVAAWKRELERAEA